MRFLAASSSNEHLVNNGPLCSKKNVHYQPPGYKSLYNHPNPKNVKKVQCLCIFTIINLKGREKPF